MSRQPYGDAGVMEEPDASQVCLCTHCCAVDPRRELLREKHGARARALLTRGKNRTAAERRAR